jgi:hypothetical protein
MEEVIGWLAVSPDDADHGWVHELFHDYCVTPAKMLPQEMPAMGDFGGAEVTLQPVLHF